MNYEKHHAEQKIQTQKKDTNCIIPSTCSSVSNDRKKTDQQWPRAASGDGIGLKGTLGNLLTYTFAKTQNYTLKMGVLYPMYMIPQLSWLKIENSGKSLGWESTDLSWRSGCHSVSTTFPIVSSCVVASFVHNSTTPFLTYIHLLNLNFILINL